jgi:hypothetical protein
MASRSMSGRGPDLFCISSPPRAFLHVSIESLLTSLSGKYRASYLYSSPVSKGHFTMDPISFIGTLASAGAIIGAITKVAHTLASLRGRFNEADITLRLLLAELSAVKAALVQVEDWANYNASNGPVQQELAIGFSDSLEGCQLAMDLLDEEVTRLAGGFVNSEDDFGARMRTVWSESSMKEHHQRLHGQIAALQLLLQAVQM